MSFSRLTAPLRRLAHRYADAEGGNVAMMFALFMVPVLAASGLAVDLAMAYRVRSVTQGAVDTAALAAGRAAQTNSSTPLSSASTAATQYFNIAKPANWSSPREVVRLEVCLRA